ncbi:MAG: MATE family efflux transporter [Tunicatimonas sp.]|uniref:MATE family efflux transporter n=1 Tax=Tunicatimonas sp. TaxID=1940096 RepID=UPI003C71CBE5
MSVQSYQTHVKKTLLIAYPVMLSQLGHILVGVADSIMVGELGTQPLAAVSLANSLFGLVLMFGIGLSIAITPLVAAADGEGNTQQMGRVFQHGAIINTIAGFIFCGLVIFGGKLLPFMNQPQAVVTLAVPYLELLAYSLIPFMVFQTFRQFAEGLAFTRTAMLITISANLINIALNYLLIYGRFGFPELGLNGAGVATLVARILMAIAIGWYVLRARWFPTVGRLLAGIRYSLFTKMLKIGVPTGLQYIFEVGAFAAASIMMGWLGATALAAHQIALNLSAVSYMVATGLAAAATVRVGNQLGRKDFPNLRRVGFSAILMSLVLMSFSALAFITLNHWLPSLYIDELPVIELAGSLLIISAFFQLSDGCQAVALGALRGMADVKIPTIITLIAYWVIGLPSGYGFAFGLGWGPQGVWVGLLLSLTIAAVLLTLRFHLISRRRQERYTSVA